MKACCLSARSKLVVRLQREVGEPVPLVSGALYYSLAIRDKELRASPAAAQAAGNIKLVRGAWNEAFLQEVSVFPRGFHDDQVDGMSGAFNWLTAVRKVICV